MTRRRRLAALACVLAAFPVGVAAAAPGFNSADGLAVALPITFIWAVWPTIIAR